MSHIIVIFHHGGYIYKGKYVSKVGNIIFSIDKDHFSLTELKSVSHIEHGINGKGEVDQPLDEENGDSLNFEEDDLDDVPDQDDSEVDEELRAFREKLREDKKK
ncbi:hypothetical protein H5410_059607 [Solanum commersonii]|uniref:Uncharacterized protein n=1 Tax=Solanum commersonii TaxID=4109 RepID=A0A9J5W360_SOLCO|nr:hypothetical protein H5410_059607 [Solanum commersonii]